jgi:hypothetical protein
MIVLVYYLLFIVVTLYINNYRERTVVDSFVNYTQCSKYKISKRLMEIFKTYKFSRSFSETDWDLYLPCGYTNVEKELLSIKPIHPNQIVFAIDGCDKIVSKYELWKVLRQKYGPHYKKYMPATYECTSKGLKELLMYHNQTKKYIVKKDLQQQKGLHIIHNINQFPKLVGNPDNLIIQELLDDPFTINKRKINMRVYLLIICKANIVSAYIHSNGFLYYTPKPFDYYSTNKDSHITTGYIDRAIYETNPLSIDDFRTYLVKHKYNANIFHQNMVYFFKQIMNALHIPICNNSNLKDGTAFQLFGCDIAIDNQLGVKLMEINKGPDLDSKSKRDNHIKQEVILDVFEKINMIQQHTKRNRFIKVR